MYKGRYQRKVEKMIAEITPTIEVNWINMSEKEVIETGVLTIRQLLISAGYEMSNETKNSIAPEFITDFEENRKALPQETWVLK